MALDRLFLVPRKILVNLSVSSCYSVLTLDNISYVKNEYNPNSGSSILQTNILEPICENLQLYNNLQLNTELLSSAQCGRLHVPYAAAAFGGQKNKSYSTLSFAQVEENLLGHPGDLLHIDLENEGQGH